MRTTWQGVVFCCRPSEPAPPTPSASEPSSLPRVSSRSYDLQERRRTGNMTGTEQAKYQRIPTDEFEAQTLASADLDGIKSEFLMHISSRIHLFFLGLVENL